MTKTYPNHRRLKEALPLMAASLLAAQSFGLTFSGESNLFDLTPSPVNTYFSAESNIFSLEGRESAYDFNISATYSTAQELFRVTTYVYDRGAGAIVSSGTGTFRVTQGGQTLASGSLAYSSASRLWDSGSVALVAAGTLGVQVTVNGRTSATTLLIPSSAPVHLTGWAKQDNGTGISGGTVRLYAASTVFGATDLNNLPAPLASRTSGTDGSFDFSDWQVGQYVLTLQTGNGLTVGAAFWLRSGETTHSETIIENPGRTDLLNRFLSLKGTVGTRILDDHTLKMYQVASTVDSDLDTSISNEDWFKLLFNIVAGTVYNYGTAYAVGLSSSHFGDIAKGVAQEKATDLKQLTSFALKAEEQFSVENQSHLAVGAAAQPFFAYGRQGLTAELDEIASILDDDTKKLYDPTWTPSDVFLGGEFDRDGKPHSHLQAWFRSQGSGSLGMYAWADAKMTAYYGQFVAGLPTLPTSFSVSRAQRILRASEDQLTAISQGSALVYVSPLPTEATVDGSGIEPLALSLSDFYAKYQSGRRINNIVDRVKDGSSWVSIAGWTTAGGCAVAGSFTGGASLPFAAGAATVAKAASWVGVGASVIQAPVVADMGATYAQMVTKHNADIAVAPLALKRTQDFILQEAASPYYLNTANQFGGEVQSVTLEGAVNVFGKSVYFPLRLNFLPFLPPLETTGEKKATVEFRNLPGRNTATFRVETKIIRNSGEAHNHVVIPGGQLGAGQSTEIEVPFMGYMLPNSILRPSTFEARLWTGPFQADIPKTRQLYVVPIGFDLSGFSAAEQEVKMMAAMRAPLSFVKTENEPMSGEDILAIADRIRDQVETNLVLGANSFAHEYAFPTNIFGAEFRLYRPVGASVAFRVEMNGEYIGWDETAGATHLGFPGEHSGNEANPEAITIPNIGGQTVTVQVALGAVETEEVNVLLEVWEQPVRSAVMAVLPEALNSISRTGITHVVEVAIGESSHQHPLESVSFAASPLRSAGGAELNWSTVSWVGTTNIPAAGLKTCSMELDTRGVEDGTYTGSVTVASANAGTVTVPVSITVDGQAPAIAIQPIREWWFNPTGPVVAWQGQDNVSAQSNLLYSYILEPLDGSWSGYLQTTNRDLSGMADGSYLLSVLARDQALNETETAAGMVIRIDRAGNLWKQRIVDADPDDEITDIGQVVWTDDFDGDGANNLMEFYAGTDPTNAGDLFAFAQADASPTGVVIHWKVKRGITYQVRRTSNLVSGPWEDAPTGVGGDEKSLVTAPADGESVYRDATPITGAMFYKIETRE